MPQSVKYSWAIPLFVNNVKGWITALVMQQSINQLSSVPPSEKLIWADLLPFPVLPCDRSGCASLSWGLKDTWLGPSPQGRRSLPPPYPAGKASLCWEQIFTLAVYLVCWAGVMQDKKCCYYIYLSLPFVSVISDQISY